MKTIRVLAAVAALSLAGAAQAEQIKFDFSGTVSGVFAGDEAYIGQQASGHFLFDTDDFSILSSDETGTGWTDLLPFDAPPPPIVASFTLGNDTFSFNSEPNVYGGIGFSDVCRPVCPLGQGEGWNIVALANTWDYAHQPFNGNFTASDLNFSSFEFDQNFNGVDFIDSTVLTPRDVLTLPIEQVIASYDRWDYTCTDGQCEEVRHFTAQFTPTSVTRSLVEPTSVAEPGTAGLFGAALLGLGAFSLRRRAVAAV